MRFSFSGEGCFPTGRHYPAIAHLIRVAAAGLVDEFDVQTLLAELPLVSIDTETTGRDFEQDRIVEIACVIYRHGRVETRHNFLVNPQRPIPKEAFEVHGISDEDVRDKPTFKEIASEVLESLQGCVPVAYNAEFDQRFLLKELERCGYVGGKLPPAARRGVKWVDPLAWARYLHKDAKSKALGAMAELLGVDLERAHRATDDAVAAVLVLARFFEDARVPQRYGAFMQEQQRLMRIQEEERSYWRSA